MELKELIAQYLKDNEHMQLATVADGQPWLCTVYFVADENFSMYWTSARSRRHSLEILRDSKVAVTVVRDTERKQALQIVGNAYEVDVDDLKRVHGLYAGKYGPKDYDLEAIARREPDGRSYWVFKPTEMYLWDEVNFPDSPKQHFSVTD